MVSAGLSILCLLLLPRLAVSGGGVPAVGTIVHDPTAYLQHVRSVQSAVVAEGQRVQQLHQQLQSLILQARQHETMISQLASIRAEDLLPARAISDEGLRRVGEYLHHLDRLGGSLESLRAEAVRTQQSHALSRLTWPEYVEREHASSRQRLARQQQAFAQARQAMNRVEADFVQVREVQARIPHTEGSHQSLQMLNQQMGLLLAQNAAAQSSLAQHSAAQAHEAALAEVAAGRNRRLRELELQAADDRASRTREVAARARAAAVEAIEARRLGR